MTTPAAPAAATTAVATTTYKFGEVLTTTPSWLPMPAAAIDQPVAFTIEMPETLELSAFLAAVPPSDYDYKTLVDLPEIAETYRLAGLAMATQPPSATAAVATA